MQCVHRHVSVAAPKAIRVPAATLRIPRPFSSTTLQTSKQATSCCVPTQATLGATRQRCGGGGGGGKGRKGGGRAGAGGGGYCALYDACVRDTCVHAHMKHPPATPPATLLVACTVHRQTRTSTAQPPFGPLRPYPCAQLADFGCAVLLGSATPTLAQEEVAVEGEASEGAEMAGTLTHMPPEAFTRGGWVG